MDSDAIKNEIKVILEAMGFGQDLENIESHEGTTNRFSVRLRHDGGEFNIEKEGDNADGRDAHLRRSDSVGILIGEQGWNLLALEHILKKILKKKFGNEIRFTLDINDYRMKRLEDLKQDVKEAAKEVRMYRKDVALRPVSAFERRIIHMLLAEYPDITTESIGMEPYRRVVIKPYP